MAGGAGGWRPALLPRVSLAAAHDCPPSQPHDRSRSGRPGSRRDSRPRRRPRRLPSPGRERCCFTESRSQLVGRLEKPRSSPSKPTPALRVCAGPRPALRVRGAENPAGTTRDTSPQTGHVCPTRCPRAGSLDAICGSEEGGHPREPPAPGPLHHLSAPESRLHPPEGREASREPQSWPVAVRAVTGSLWTVCGRNAHARCPPVPAHATGEHVAYRVCRV